MGAAVPWVRDPHRHFCFQMPSPVMAECYFQLLTSIFPWAHSLPLHMCALFSTGGGQTVFPTSWVHLKAEDCKEDAS